MERISAKKALYEYPWAKKRNAPEDAAIIHAVENAMDEQSKRVNGEARIRMMEMKYFRKTHTLLGVAMECNYSPEIVKRWNSDLLSAVNMALRYEQKETE